MQYLLISTIVMIVLYFLNKASKKQVESFDNGGYLLRMSKIYQVVGVLGILMSIVILFMPVLAEEYTVEIYVATGVFCLFMLGLTLPCFLLYRNHSLQFDKIQMVSTNFYGREYRVKWEDVEQIRYSSLSGSVIITDKEGKFAKAHLHLVGFSTFVQELNRQKNEYNFSCGPIPGN